MNGNDNGMEGGLHGNGANGFEGGLGGPGEGAALIREKLGMTFTTSSPNLREIYAKDLLATETAKIKAEAELEKSKTEFLHEQLGLVDPAHITPPIAETIPGEGSSILPLLGLALYFLF